jgi:hypothetical protein
MDGQSATSTDSTTGTTIDGRAVHLLNLLKENNLQVLVAILIAQQMGWLSTATTHLSGVCF